MVVSHGSPERLVGRHVVSIVGCVLLLVVACLRGLNRSIHLWWRRESSVEIVIWVMVVDGLVGAKRIPEADRGVCVHVEGCMCRRHE